MCLLLFVRSGHVTLETALMIECGATLIASVLVSTSVNNQVAIERAHTEEVFLTFGAHLWPFSSVRTHVFFQVAPLAECCTAHRKFGRLLPTMPQVKLETFVGQECLATLIAVCLGQLMLFCQGPIQVLQKSCADEYCPL